MLGSVDFPFSKELLKMEKALEDGKMMNTYKHEWTRINTNVRECCLPNCCSQLSYLQAVAEVQFDSLAKKTSF